MPIIDTLVNYILPFIVLLTILVLVHELGHFIMAKKFGIKVEEFGFGFPPRAFGFKHGETVYSINWLPIGGFVKLYGEDDAGGGSVKGKSGQAGIKDRRRAFFARSAAQRAIVVVAGVVMNFLLAITIISYLFSSRGIMLPSDYVTITEFSKTSPAPAAGFKIGDKVLSVNGTNIKTPDDFIRIAHANVGKQITVDVRRNSGDVELKVTPRKTYPKGDGPIGVGITNEEFKKYPWYQAPFYGTIEAVKFSWTILSGLGGMVSQLVIERKAPAGVGGPVAVAELTGEVAKQGAIPFIWLAAVLSLNLGVVNILPIPALDGGRFFFILIELIIGRKISSKYETMAHAVGLAILLSFMLFITVLDVLHLLSGQSLIPKM
ncbi:MAG TPA: M50 family metallopeptidase [Patescibacteria group bacterium]|nr:M50 family metallopeptidase [Patescibacteria group bacterium]